MKHPLFTAIFATLATGHALAAEFQLMIYEAPAEFAKRSDAGRAGKAYWDAYQAYGAALQAAGVLRGGGALQGSREARTVTVEGSATRIAMRPAASSINELGGYFLIDVVQPATALAWAAKAPSAATGGAVEVRPLYPVPGMSAVR